MSYERHGDTGTRLYRIWKSMKCRCNSINHPTYKWYGARGIKLCREWEQSYSTFKTWATSHGYADSLEIERIDVNQGYSPCNCKWISHYDQTLNRRDTLYVTVGCHTTKLREFCKSRKINLNTVNNWRHLGVIETKLSEITGESVTVTGGKKEVVSV